MIQNRTMKILFWRRCYAIWKSLLSLLLVRRYPYYSRPPRGISPLRPPLPPPPLLPTTCGNLCKKFPTFANLIMWGSAIKHVIQYCWAECVCVCWGGGARGTRYSIQWKGGGARGTSYHVGGWGACFLIVINIIISRQCPFRRWFRPLWWFKQQLS